MLFFMFLSPSHHSSTYGLRVGTARTPRANPGRVAADVEVQTTTNTTLVFINYSMSN